jgi:hypothetical protein
MAVVFKLMRRVLGNLWANAAGALSNHGVP